MAKLDCITKQRHHFANKGLYRQSYGFSCNNVWMWELDQKEGWMLMLLNCGVGEASCESLGLQGDQTSPKGNQPWIFVGSTHVEAEALILWPPDVKHWFTGKYNDVGKDWGQEHKGMTENETAGWHHRLNGHAFEKTQGDSEGQGSLACCSSWGHKELNTVTEKHQPKCHLTFSDNSTFWVLTINMTEIIIF